MQETATSLVTPDVVGSIPTPLGDSSVGRTPLCLFLDFSACFSENNACIAEYSYFDWSETFAIMVRGSAGSSPAELYSILSRFIFIKIYEE